MNHIRLSLFVRHLICYMLVAAFILLALPWSLPAVHAAGFNRESGGPTIFLPAIYFNQSATSFMLGFDDGTETRGADDGAVADPTQDGWDASYWDNESLSGPPIVTRLEPTLEHYWFSGEAPAPGLPTSSWSARWMQTATFEAHNYRFYASTDDGMRVYVDGELLIDQWREQSVQTFTADVVLAAGAHEIWVEYFETGGPGVAKVTWQKAEPLPTDSWRAEFFNNIELEGAPVLVRADDEIDFDWGEDSPEAGVVNADDFSVRWSRSVYFEEGRYKFETKTNDGVRLYVDDMLIIDQWRSMATTKYTEKIRLTEGNHRIRMEYFDDGNAVARLTWSETSESVNRDVGNIITCVPKNPPAYAWIRIYRRSGDEWVKVTQKGIGSIHPSGFLKVDGLEVDTGAYSDDGHPYRVEQWINNVLTQSVGNTDVGEAEFRLFSGQDNYTPWGCP